MLETRTSEPVFCARGCLGTKTGRPVFVLPEDVKEELDLALCAACGKGTCTLCRAPAPHGETEGVCAVQGEAEREEIRYVRLSGRSGWRCCESCGMMVSRDVGCSHVVCRYDCGPWEGGRLLVLILIFTMLIFGMIGVGMMFGWRFEQNSGLQ